MDMIVPLLPSVSELLTLKEPSCEDLQQLAIQGQTLPRYWLLLASDPPKLFKLDARVLRQTMNFRHLREIDEGIACDCRPYDSAL
jgi:hypothetical protein